MVKRRGGGPGISFFAFQDIITAVVGIFILITLILVLELAQRVETASSAHAEDIKPVIEMIEKLKEQIESAEAEMARRTDQIDDFVEVNAFNLAEKSEQAIQQIAALKSRVETSIAKQTEVTEEARKVAVEAERLAKDSQALSGAKQDRNELAIKANELQTQVNVLLGDESTVYRDTVDGGRYLVLVILSPGKFEIRDALTRSVEQWTGPNRQEKMEEWLEQTPLARRHLLIFIEPGGEADFDSVRKRIEQEGAQYGFTVVGPDHAIRLGYELDSSL